MNYSVDWIIRARRTLIDGSFVAASVGVLDGVIVSIGAFEDGHAAVSNGALPPKAAVSKSAVRETVVPDHLVLIPGLVDSHVHINEPGRTQWEGFATATRAAASGGVTTVIDMPLNSIPATLDVDALELKRAAAVAQVVIDVGFWGGAVPFNLGTLGELHERGVFGFKSFLSPSGVDEFPHISTAELGVALDEVADLGALLIVHSEDPMILDDASNEGGRDYARFVDSRPESSELAAISHVIEGVRRTGARAHILHLSSAAALPLIAAAKVEGLPITVETCPHYLTLTAEQISDGATQFKCCPPIRDAHNRDLLWAGLVDGVIDCIVSDHSPSTRELKLGFDGDFARAWGGISGLEVGLSAVWTEAAARGIPLESVIGWMSGAPATLVGLSSKGRIAVGADADLVVFDPLSGFTVDVSQLHHKNPVSAYDGAALTGKVVSTWLRGQPVVVDGQVVEHPPVGRLLSRSFAKV